MKSSRIAIFDLFSGISGDMLLGALLDLGADPTLLCQAIDTLGLPGFQLEWEKLQRKGITGLKATVHVEEEAHPHRRLADIEEIVKSGNLPSEVVEQSIQVFRRIAEAESKIHGKSLDQIHFHEVGALDAIIDVTGCLLAIQDLGIEYFYASSISVGTGTIDGSHGTLPVPCPASVEILGDFPLDLTGIRQELVTPTGAALLRHLVPSPGLPPSIKVERVGYGAGSRDIPGRANVVRILMGIPDSSGSDLVTVIETNIDDMNPEIYGYLLDRLFKAGALDAFLMPIIGKKNRPAILVTVLCPIEKELPVTDTLLLETTSLGVRTYRCSRTCLQRQQESVQTRWGTVKAKVARHRERIKVAPEYEDCRRIAEQHGIPLLDVYEEVRRIYGV